MSDYLEPPNNAEILAYLMRPGTAEVLEEMAADTRKEIKRLKDDKKSRCKKRKADYAQVEAALKEVKPMVDEYLDVKADAVDPRLVDSSIENLAMVSEQMADIYDKSQKIALPAAALVVVGAAGTAAAVYFGYPFASCCAAPFILGGGLGLAASALGAYVANGIVTGPMTVLPSGLFDEPFIWKGDMSKCLARTVEAHEYTHMIVDRATVAGRNGEYYSYFHEGMAWTLGKDEPVLEGEKRKNAEIFLLQLQAERFESMARYLKKEGAGSETDPDHFFRQSWPEEHDAGTSYFELLAKEAGSPDALRERCRQYIDPTCRTDWEEEKPIWVTWPPPGGEEAQPAG